MIDGPAEAGAVYNEFYGLHREHHRHRLVLRLGVVDRGCLCSAGQHDDDRAGDNHDVYVDD